MIYILFSLLFIFIIYKLFKTGDLSFELFLFWEATAAGVLLVSLFPGGTDTLIRHIIGSKISSHFLFAISIFGLFSITASQSVKLRKHSKKTEQIIRELALSNVHTPPRPDGKQCRTLVKMAAYNEAGSICHVLEQMPTNVDVLVIDDGSSDKTFELAVKHGAAAIRHASNIGQGAADVTGFEYALKFEYEYIIEMDADGQHDPADIASFIQVLDASDIDIVTGSRILGETHATQSAVRNFFLPYFTHFLNRLTGYNLTDSMCGFKGFRAGPLRKNADIFTEIVEHQYLASELYIRLSKRKFTIKEIPITIAKRHQGTSRKGMVKYGIRVLKVMALVWLLEKLTPRTR